MTIYEKAILETIAYGEGTLGVSQNGYDVLFNFYVIEGWSENTNIRHRCIKTTDNLTENKLKEKGYSVCEDKTWDRDNSTAVAGRYQFKGSSWATTTEKMGLGFNAPMTKKNQDDAAIRTVKVKRKVTETELKNAYNSFNSFEVVRNKLINEWTSLELNNSKKKKTPKDYWEVYKYAVKKYKQG